MIGRFIFLCDLDNIIVAGKAVKALVNHPESKDIVISQGEGDSEIRMYAKRLKKSFSVRQIKP